MQVVQLLQKIVFIIVIFSIGHAEDVKKVPNQSIELIKKTEILIDNTPSIMKDQNFTINGQKIQVSFANNNMTISANGVDYLSVKDGVVFRHKTNASSLVFVVYTTVGGLDFSGMYFENVYSITIAPDKEVRFKKHFRCVMKRELWTCNELYYLASVDEIIGFSEDGNTLLCKASLIQKALVKPGAEYEFWEVGLKLDHPVVKEAQ